MQRILVVDDEHLTADTLGLIFHKNGFEVRTAYSSEEAIACARDFQPELLLCDITMPGKDGIELMVEIGKAFPACQILVLTGYYSNLSPVHDHVRKMPHPARVLTKPCNPRELLRTAGAMLAATA
ncbi:response regulator [Granulicella sibirica]|uniref:Two-component response regulator SA14-24 n=1 Tax=Granulicella sibirica TaxID=2479048 RepID=A0A4Q0SYZ1_9BACT|nr:response regulator [Granulicella sibirica]RXH55220.1 Two-component response regulator SA14-24 [Granulicella sibirica]